MINPFLSYHDAILLLARAGGGGSSGGGGGGGGIETIFILAGYFPSYYLGKIIKRLFSRRTELIISFAFGVLASIVLLIIGLHLGALGVYATIMVIVGIWSGWSAAFFGIWSKLRKKSTVAKKQIYEASRSDGLWNETAMMETARATFLNYQNDWATFNIQNMQHYMTQGYTYHASLLMAALKQLGRSNRLTNLNIDDAMIVEARDNFNNSDDGFDVAFNASAVDELIDTQGNVLFKDKSSFIEYWHFSRINDTWLLSGITQQTQVLSAGNLSLKDFATQNNLYYSLDMGWLLLPQGGLLMERGRFGKSDINNHTIGLYNNHLVQLYTYSPLRTNSGADSWLVIQIVLPKSYGGIIVQPRRKYMTQRSAYNKPTKAYGKYTFEWGEFNDHYDVYATRPDQLATFELINPGFMAELYDSGLDMSIEVVDNVLYLYRHLGMRFVSEASSDEYRAMLNIALKAFKELRL